MRSALSVQHLMVTPTVQKNVAPVIKGPGLDYRTRNLVYEECLCYKNGKVTNNVFS